MMHKTDVFIDHETIYTPLQKLGSADFNGTEVTTCEILRKILMVSFFRLSIRKSYVFSIMKLKLSVYFSCRGV